MKSLFIIIIFFALVTKSLFADYREIDITEKVINFTSYCESGKITVFIISEHGCSPCFKCKEFLLDQKYDMKKVDIYYCLFTKNIEDLKDHKYESRPSNKMWSYLEGCTRPPYVYIFGPTKNPVSIINGFIPEKIDNNIKLLIASLQYYQEKLLDMNGTDLTVKDTINKKSNKKYEILKAEHRQLMNENKALKDLNNSNIEEIKRQKDQFEKLKADFEIYKIVHSSSILYY